MGAAESVRVTEEDSEEEDEEGQEEEEAEDINGDHNRIEIDGSDLVKKVLQQEPEMLPFHESASPLSPQLSSLGTPRLGPSIKVWDPYNVLAPPPPPPPVPFFSRSYSSSPTAMVDEDRAIVEVFLVSHGECDLNLRPDLVGGRCHTAALTPNGKRQARALAVFLNSNGIRFNAVYSSPLSRSRSMAVSVCQEMNFSDEQIQSFDALTEISLGLWEGIPSSEIYTPEIVALIESSQPDFCAPSGESLRQVEFRMVQFLNDTILGLPEKLRSDFLSPRQNESQHWDAVHRHRPGLSRKKSGKSRLQYVTTTGNGNHEGEEEISPTESNHQNSLHNLSMRSSSASNSSCIGVFTHSTPIKCLLTGILGCSPLMSHKICIEDSSVTVLQHSWRTGWQIKRLNDKAHLRIL